MRATFRSLRHRNYQLWAAGALVSNIGTWMQRIAEDWLVLTVLTHRSATALGIVSALQYGPQLLLLPWTGSAADRLDRRRLLIVTQLALGVLALLFGMLVMIGALRLWEAYAFAFLGGCVAAFDAPARHSFVSELVGPEDLANAVALNSTSFNAARMLGPAVAGLAIARFGSGPAFLINGFSFVAVIASLLLLRKADLRPAPRIGRGSGDFLEGLRYAWTTPEIRACLGMLVLLGTFGLNFPIFISTMATTVLHRGAGGYGLLNTVMAVGTIAGALFAAGRRRPGLGLLSASAAIFGLGFLPAVFWPGFWLFAACLAVIGLAALIFTTATSSLMQLAAVPEMRGRVMALRIAVALGGTPIGGPVTGWIADHAGPRAALLVGAAAGLAAAILGLWAGFRVRLPRSAPGK
jgi:MFS family permease